MADSLNANAIEPGTITTTQMETATWAQVYAALATANAAYAVANSGLSSSQNTTITGNMFFATGSKLGINTLTPNTALHVNGTMTVSETIEKINVSAAGLGTSLNFDILTQPILYLTGSSTANCTINFRANSTTPIESFLATGQSITTTTMVTNSTTAYYINDIRVDSVTPTVKWAGGTAPTSGNPNAIDLYSFTIIKTAPLAYVVLASQLKYS